MISTTITFPTPPYSNPPIEPQFYQPSRFVISDITLGETTLVTTSIDHNYVIGQQVRFIIPPAYGTRGLNEQSGLVISIPALNQLIVDISSKFFDPFVAASTDQNPQIMAIGDVNSGYINANGRNFTGTFIPGSFIDISPL